MIITLVLDSYDDTSNGIAIAAKRLAKVFIDKGHTVKILASEVKDNDVIGYSTGIRKTPILYQVSKSQGFFFAKIDKKTIKDALKGSDIVHFMLPFKLERVAKKICDKEGIPSTGAFHLQPENITSTLKLNEYSSVNKSIYEIFKKFYDKFNHVHCPSNMIKGQLINNGYKSNLHVISNGVSKAFYQKNVEKKLEWQDKFVILMIGRLSAEKRQDLIIKAVLQSKFEKKIQIVLAGKGPMRENYEKIGERLTNKIEFGFYSEEELANIINMADLYVHASDAEIEAIACIEAFSCGIVPIISDSPLSATNQFALDEKNLFQKGNYLSLRDKIDYWLENVEEKEKRSKEYIEYSKQYALDYCSDKLLEMFNLAVSEVKK